MGATRWTSRRKRAISPQRPWKVAVNRLDVSRVYEFVILNQVDGNLKSRFDKLSLTVTIDQIFLLVFLRHDISSLLTTITHSG
jgi:hypothetical protein